MRLSFEIPQSEKDIEKIIRDHPDHIGEITIQLATNEDGQKKLLDKQGKLAKFIINQNPNTADVIAHVMVSTEPGRDILTNHAEHFFNGANPINGAAATYFAYALAEGSSQLRTQHSEHAAGLVAQKHAEIAKILFQKNRNGTAPHLAKLLVETDQGKHELTAERVFHTTPQQIEDEEPAFDFSEHDDEPRPRSKSDGRAYTSKFTTEMLSANKAGETYWYLRNAGSIER